jgi:Pregnancy-associated plasma protein-A
MKIPPLRRTCGAMQVHFRLLELHPEFRLRLAELENATRMRLTSGQGIRNGLVTIPVVVHVVYKVDAENISDEQVLSQIHGLNRNYRRRNIDWVKTPKVWRGLATDATIRFELAGKDPKGTNTNGITRTRTARASFADDDAVKSSAKGGADGWPSDRYLNLWICSLGGGLLGYAQFPGGPAETDGVVILNKAFGKHGSATPPFDLARTAVHEVGHWLNLHHVWGDTADCSGSDFVADTPNAKHPNYGKPTFPHISCGNGPNGDMFMNFMDYVDDDTMVMFTSGQVQRMRATLDGPRSTIGI